jgi:hypothetical protein
MDIIQEHLAVPSKYMILTDGRICLTVHRNWLSRLLTIGPFTFINHDRLSNDEIAAQPTPDELGHDWLRVYAKVYKHYHLNLSNILCL